MALSRRAFLSLLGTAAVAAALPAPAWTSLAYEPELVALPAMPTLVGLRQATEVVLQRFVETLDTKRHTRRRVAEYVAAGARVGHTLAIREPIPQHYELERDWMQPLGPFTRVTPVTLAHQKNIMFALQPGREAEREQLAVCGEMLGLSAIGDKLNAFANLPTDFVTGGGGVEAVSLMRDGVCVRGVMAFDPFWGDESTYDEPEVADGLCVSHYPRPGYQAWDGEPRDRQGAHGAMVMRFDVLGGKL